MKTLDDLLRENPDLEDGEIRVSPTRRKVLWFKPWEEVTGVGEWDVNSKFATIVFENVVHHFQPDCFGKRWTCFMLYKGENFIKTFCDVKEEDIDDNLH